MVALKGHFADPTAPPQIPKLAFWIFELVLLKAPAVLCPMAVTAPMTAMRMSASMTAYSTAVAAVSSLRNWRMRSMLLLT